MINQAKQEELLKLAKEARERSYSPYSHYQVGAALLTKDGRIYQGCNIENASFTPSICDERHFSKLCLMAFGILKRLPLSAPANLLHSPAAYAVRS